MDVSEKTTKAGFAMILGNYKPEVELSGGREKLRQIAASYGLEALGLAGAIMIEVGQIVAAEPGIPRASMRRRLRIANADAILAVNSMIKLGLVSVQVEKTGGRGRQCLHPKPNVGNAAHVAQVILAATRMAAA